VSAGGRRKIAVSLAGLAAVPALLAACGNADHKVSRDNRPDPRASTEGVQSALPVPVANDSNLNTPFDGVPPENLVSQQGVGKRK
jgi:hypothetical protein